MTNPTISLRNGWKHDCDDTTGWTETEDGNTCALTVENQDWFKLNVTVSAGNKVAYYSYPDEAGAPDIDILSDTYPKITFKYKTSSTSIKAKIVLIFSDATTQTVLAEASSTTWKSGSAAITSGKTIDHIRLYANQATGYVLYDFALIHKATFTFPAVGPGGVRIEHGVKLAVIEIPGKDGDELQHLGLKSPIITIRGNALGGEEGWRSGTEAAPTGPHFEYLLDALHKDVWNWFTCDYPYIRCKVMFEDFTTEMVVPEKGEPRLQYVVTLVMHVKGSLTDSNFGDVEWMGYES